MSCSYETECSKGPDRGFNTAVEHYLCLNCHEVGNVTTGKAERRGGPIVEKIQPTCRKCAATENLTSWDLITCPKCGKPDVYYHYLSSPWD
jgi:Zn finger protein HypA/HybF involved in hydrogenase expression